MRDADLSNDGFIFVCTSLLKTVLEQSVFQGIMFEKVKASDEALA